MADEKIVLTFDAKGINADLEAAGLDHLKLPEGEGLHTITMGGGFALTVPTDHEAGVRMAEALWRIQALAARGHGVSALKPKAYQALSRSVESEARRALGLDG